jgi:hypothetical protein
MWQAVSDACGGASAGERVDQRRAFHGRRDIAGSLGRGESFQPKDKKQQPPDDPGNPTVNFCGERRSNETHESKTDPEALLAKKGQGKESKLSYTGNLPVENRNGLIVDAEVFQASGTAERESLFSSAWQQNGFARAESARGESWRCYRIG